MITTIEKSLLDSTAEIIVQQVNCKGVMGAGLAKSIRNKYPEVYPTYHKAFENGDLKLGNVIYVYVNNNKQIVANMCGQNGYGRKALYTDYDAFKICLGNLKEYADSRKIKTIAFPKGIGCGLAGGNWDIVSEMIKETFDSSDINVEICTGYQI